MDELATLRSALDLRQTGTQQTVRAAGPASPGKTRQLKANAAATTGANDWWGRYTDRNGGCGERCSPHETARVCNSRGVTGPVGLAVLETMSNVLLSISTSIGGRVDCPSGKLAPARSGQERPAIVGKLVLLWN